MECVLLIAFGPAGRVVTVEVIAMSGADALAIEREDLPEGRSPARAP
jgi:hypothetical protein